MYIKVSLIVWIGDIEQDKPSEVVIDGKHDKTQQVCK